MTCCTPSLLSNFIAEATEVVSPENWATTGPTAIGAELPADLKETAIRLAKEGRLLRKRLAERYITDAKQEPHVVLQTQYFRIEPRKLPTWGESQSEFVENVVTSAPITASVELLLSAQDSLEQAAERELQSLLCIQPRRDTDYTVSPDSAYVPVKADTVVGNLKTSNATVTTTAAIPSGVYVPPKAVISANPSITLKVTNINPSVTEEELIDFFRERNSHFPEGVRVRLKTDDDGKSRGLAFVTYRRGEDAKTAMRDIQGYPLAHCCLNIEIAESRIGPQ